MTNPTTPFSWQMPTSTDLVTDLPADFAVFGQAVATSMADLLGGTTGQVLSKASNTDMDFTWVAQDDSNAIQNAIVDAKGDLIAATAADTPARLAVGSNFAFLQADSSTATGLLWNNAAWTSYTPTITASSGTFTTTTTTLAKYARIGKTCIVKVEVKIVNAGTAGGNMKISLPFNSTADAADLCVGTFRESGNTGILGQFRIYGSIDATNALAVSYNNTTIIVNGSWVSGTFIYEVA
jgi:hypothetical protein